MTAGNHHATRRSLLAPGRCAALLAAAWLGACAGDAGDGGVGECSMFIAFEALPGSPPMVRADAHVMGAVVFQYTWKVTHAGSGPVTHTPAQLDGSAIVFSAHQPGEYVVRFDVDDDNCVTAESTFFQMGPGGAELDLRLRVVPPASASMPPYEKSITVFGGAPTWPLGRLALEPGKAVSAVVQSGATRVPAFLRLMPVTGKGAAVELFTDGAGQFGARLLDLPHEVLVIPTVPGYAPQLVSGFVPGAPAINVVAGNVASGTVLGPTGAPLAGAKVQLEIGGIPSTLATTAADGTFSLRTVAPPGATVSVDVAPPAGSGLPRLLAREVDLPASLQIRYASIAMRDLAGATIRRGGTPIPGARVVVVGELPSAGTVSGSALPVDGTVRIAVTAGSNGALPAAFAPARLLSAVVEAAPNDHAVAAIDLTAGTPATIDAPPAVSVSTRLRLWDDATPAPDAVLDAFPIGPLAWAGVTSSVRARAGGGGQLTASLASGGRYQLWIHDPVLGRGALRVLEDVPVQAVAASYTLQKGLAVTGKLELQGPSEAPIGGAAVQLLCAQCGGLDRDRPLAESTSRPDGSFSLVIADPGT